MADELNEIDIVSILVELCQLLSRDPLKLDDVRPVLEELPLAASVEPEPGSDIPAFVRLTLPESSQPTLDILRESFGSYSETPRLHRRALAKFIFYPDSGDSPYTCALITEVESEHTAVQAVTIRRDIRLE